MSGRSERFLVDRAVERGLISRVDVESALNKTDPGASESARWRGVVAALVRAGHLSPHVIRQLGLEEDDEHRPTMRFDSVPLVSSETLKSGDAFGHYTILDPVGEGGMGRVYKALDTTLARIVALKLLRTDDTELRARLLLEAKAQARVDHPNICRVYEAGESGGRLFIAMQYIDGRTLDDLLDELALEQKVRIMRDVAEAVHAAHRVGLIHRDLKPSNIMAERDEDGDWVPYVLDFGLARELQPSGLTVTGVVLGTPWYMAPEHARGDAAALDRRADVYSLGATLYQLLTRTLVFDGATVYDVVRQVLENDPVPVRRRNPAVPADLETVVMTCLEKDPARRYDSARALAEDLTRYLDGEPIRAARASVSYRLLKKVRKHRAIFAVSAIAIVIALVLAILGAREHWNAAARAETAQAFGGQVKEIESIMRISSLLPLHDITREKALVRARMAAIERQVSTLDESARPSAHYALGRGHMALHEYDLAREELTAAWSGGLRSPDVAFALGATLGQLYDDQLREAERLRTAELRSARKKQIERELRDPALAWLALGRGTSTDAPEYIEALIDLYGGRLDEAAGKAARALARMPWLYEADLLRGDVARARANQQRDRGDYDTASRLYADASNYYGAAADAGRSDASTHQRLCSVWTDAMQLELYSRGGEVAPLFDRARAACQSALVADRERVDAETTFSSAWRFFAVYAMRHGGDASAAIAEQLKHAQRAVQIAPRSADAHHYLGAAYDLHGDLVAARGDDPIPDYDRALAEYARAIALNPNSPNTYFTAGTTYLGLSQFEAAHGRDVLHSLDEASRYYERAIALGAGNGGLYNNLGVVYRQRALYEIAKHRDPAPFFDRAITTFEKARKVSPDLAPARNNLGEVLEAHATYAVRVGADPRPFIDRALTALADALTLNPQHAPALTNVGLCHQTLAAQELRAGRTPAAELQKADDAFRKAIAANAKLIDPVIALADSRLIEARGAIARGESPLPAIERCSAELKRAESIDPSDGDLWKSRGEMFVLRAQWQIAHGVSPLTDLAAGREALARAIAADADEPDRIAMAARVAALQAEWNDARGVSSENERARARELGARAAAWPNAPEVVAFRRDFPAFR